MVPQRLEIRLMQVLDHLGFRPKLALVVVHQDGHSTPDDLADLPIDLHVHAFTVHFFTLRPSTTRKSEAVIYYISISLR